MKRKQRILAIILLCSAMLIMGIVQCFAYDYTGNTTPDDLGEEITGNTITNGIYYVYATMNNAQNYIAIEFITSNNNRILSIQNSTYGLTEGTSYTSTTNKWIGRILTIPDKITNPTSTTKSLYWNRDKYLLVSIATENNEIKINRNSDSKIYKVKGISEEDIDLAYMRGFLSGYDAGYPEGIKAGTQLKQDLNIVEHIEQLIAQFTGTEYAKYITPIALVLTILMIYFLFIRFILSLMKAKGVIKTCDILMIVACIIVLVCMYMPMINFEITQHQIIEQVETTSNNVYQVNSDVAYYTYTDDQGNTIHGGPGGTYIEYIETTTE